MMLKVYDFLRSIGWYLVHFVYDLIDAILSIIKKLNSFDILNSLSNNSTFRTFYSGVIVISLTLFALFVIWKFVNKLIDPDDEMTFKSIITETIKCGMLIMLSTFLFVQVSKFSITLSNYTGNIFENNANTTMSKTMLNLFINYNEDYQDSDNFNESKSIKELIDNDSFHKKELYLDKYFTKEKLLFADEKDYKYDINWILSLVCGGFFLYSLVFAGIMMGRRQIEFAFLFAISPVVFSTSVCNKQRRGAVIEQLVSLTLQSAVIMLVVSLCVMVMEEINDTTFFTNNIMNTTTKTLLYLGCSTFILTGSQVINRFIGSNISASSGREQLMSLMGYGKMAGVAGTIGAGATVGAGLLATGAGVEGLKKSGLINKAGVVIGKLGASENPNRMQRMAMSLGSRLMNVGQTEKSKHGRNAIFNAGANSINNAIRSVMPRAGYNTSYYRRKKNLM